MLRTEALTKLSAGGNKNHHHLSKRCFEKYYYPKTLSGNIISIKTNDSISLESPMELFVMYGFKRTDFVYEPGQFALRGGILDIYSLAMKTLPRGVVWQRGRQHPHIRPGNAAQ